ncbi:MAG: MBL fold metallo-hydrolase [Smithella sp.]
MRTKAEEIIRGVYQVGGSNLTSADDAAVYLVDFEDDVILIDAGAGRSTAKIIQNIQTLGFNAGRISHLLLTHCHIDHIGSAPFFQKNFQTKIVIHELDAPAVEKGDPVRTAANWYGTNFPPTKIDLKLKGKEEVLQFGSEKLHCLHTPGHTPGSIAAYLDRDGKRILFGQDIHGPFHKSFGSNIEDWKKSMHLLLDLEADILCEGHFGIYQPKQKVRGYIEGYLDEYA